MKIYWNKLKNDILEAGKELSMVAVYIIGAGLLVGLSPLLVPISAITVFFQNRYTDLEPNKYLSAYLAIFVALLLGVDIE